MSFPMVSLNLAGMVPIPQTLCAGFCLINLQAPSAAMAVEDAARLGPSPHDTTP